MKKKTINLSSEDSINIHINTKTVCGSCAEGGHVKQVGRHLYNSHLLMKMRRYGLLTQDHHRADVVHCQQVFSGAPLHTMEREKKQSKTHNFI